MVRMPFHMVLFVTGCVSKGSAFQNVFQSFPVENFDVSLPGECQNPFLLHAGEFS